MTYSKKTLTKALKYQLAHETAKARRALLLIYSKQTASEQTAGQTIEYNCEGFTALDADILTDIAVFYSKHQFLTPNQDRVVRRLIPKYAGQILASSIERGLIKQVSPRKYEIVAKSSNTHHFANS